MTRAIKNRLATTFAVTVVATATMLSVRAWDNDKRFVRVADCGDANADPFAGQLPGNGCIEGYDCVVCDINPQPRGDVVGKDGQGPKMWMPQWLGCSGERRIGYCTGTGGVGYCDLEDYTVDGECGGSIQQLQNQPINP